MSADPKNVGLAGDGDEIAAIHDVERAFGVELDYSDAPTWRTAGDVFQSLEKALTVEKREAAHDWARFAEALTGQSGVQPELIGPDSPLLLPSGNFWRRAVHLSAFLCIAAAACLAIFGTLAMLELS
jgi:hypothetical protein